MVRIVDVKMAHVGGQTQFAITTYVDGVKQDEKLNFQGGFRLPGAVTMYRNPRLYSKYQKNEIKYPVKSIYLIQMGTRVFADFFIQLLNEVKAGESIRVQCLSSSGNPYLLRADDFEIGVYDETDKDDLKSDLPGHIIPAEVTTIATGDGGVLEASLGKPLLPGIRYVVTVSAISPNVITGEKWLFETRDEDPLPTNTNDGLAEGFNLVGVIDMKVTATRSPPLSEIDVRIEIDPRQSKPVEMMLVAVK